MKMETITKEQLAQIKLPLSQEDFKLLNSCRIMRVEWPRPLRSAFEKIESEEAGMMPWD